MRAIIIISIVAASSAAYAQEAGTVQPPAGAWTVGVEPRVGALIPTSKLKPNVLGGLEIDIALPVANHQLTLGIDGSYAQPTYSGTAMSTQLPAPGTLAYSIDQTEVVIGLTVNYRLFDASHAFVPHVGIGPLVHLLKTVEDTMPAYSGSNNAQQTQLGGEVDAGVDYKAGPGYLAADLRFLYTSLDTPLAGSTNAGSIAIAAGYRFVF